MSKNTSDTALLLINLGSPNSCDPKDVKTYLGEFLMDEYVIDLPYLLRALLVKGIILNTRPKKSAAAYASIWWDEGSPLMVLSKRLQAKVAAKSPYPVGLAMRYANPSIQAGIQQLIDQNPNLKQLILFPLYPHYAMATTLTVLEKCKRVLKEHFPQLTAQWVPPFHADSGYVNCIANSIKTAQAHEPFDHLLFSYHGVPERHVRKTDPTNKHCMKVNNCCYSPSPAHQNCYSHHCHYSAQLITRACGLQDDQHSIAFQSRLGADAWLSPATDTRIESLAKAGVKRLAVICPAFVSDCLETLEEIGEEGQEIFKEHGGEHFQLIPCLNEQDDWVDLVLHLANQQNLCALT
eukprot:COSAG01_NODE_775_length_13698_cov_60.191632_4_plen_350_part_00